MPPRETPPEAKSGERVSDPKKPPANPTAELPGKARLQNPASPPVEAATSRAGQECTGRAPGACAACKQLEDRLRFQADVLSQASDALLAVDNQGLVSLWNPAAATILGVPAERALGQPLAAFGAIAWIMDDDTDGESKPPEANCPRTREFEHAKADGSALVVQASVSVLRDGQGKQTGLLAVLRDVSDTKRFEAELLAAKRKAEQANRSKSEFLANMSHEIRTPMSGILGMTQLALNRCLPDDVREFLLLVQQAGQSLLDIINDILDFSKIEAGRMVLEIRPFAPAALVVSTLKPLEVLARDKGLSFVYDIAPDVPATVAGDKGRLRQILTNMVGNAIKFTKKGTVAVTVRREAAREPDKVRLRFVVKDDGIGIAPDQVRSIFEKFEQASSAAHVQHGGTGLGLAISKALVEMMGGSIQVQSERDKGSVFSFDIVCGHGVEPVKAEGASMTFLRKPRPSLRILVVEDDQVNSLFAAHLLESWGHAVEMAANGQQALDLLRTMPFDLVLMDALMPIMDGEQATRRIRAGEAGNPDIPIVALTAYALQGDRNRFLAAGMDDYVSKPINLEELKQVMDRVLRAKRPGKAR